MELNKSCFLVFCFFFYYLNYGDRGGGRGEGIGSFRMVFFGIGDKDWRW